MGIWIGIYFDVGKWNIIKNLKNFIQFTINTSTTGKININNKPCLCNIFFEKIKDPARREKEPWVISALRYFHHPRRNEANIRYLEPSLEMLREIQLTGDIFFPKNWLDGSFSGYSSAEAAGIISAFLEHQQDYPLFLERKILQSADMIFRFEK